MRAPETNQDAVALALRALVWTLARARRARRLLDVTVSSADLRARAGESAVLSAGSAFSEAA